MGHVLSVTDHLGISQIMYMGVDRSGLSVCQRIVYILLHKALRMLQR